MTLPKDVQDIIGSWEVMTIDHEPDGWPAVRMRELTRIRDHLLNQDAEINRRFGIGGELIIARRERDALQCRLAAADALLRESLPPAHFVPCLPDSLVYRIQSHLLGAGDKAPSAPGQEE